MKLLSTNPYKGTRDFPPNVKQRHNWMLENVRELLSTYGYLEYDGPMLEPFDVYAAKTGQEIVEQQLYWFEDRGKRKMAMRPEMTPTFARMVASRLQEEVKPIRWFSIPNLWRYERPQRGRLREHWQVNVDVVGGNSELADFELLSLALDLFRKFGGEQHVQIRVNNRRFLQHLFDHRWKLNAENSLAVSKLLDGKAKMKPEEFEAKLSEVGMSDEVATEVNGLASMNLKEASERFPCKGIAELKSLLDKLYASGVSETQILFDAGIVRGLDYYTGTVFEAFDVSPENNRALFGGGRYDNLLGLFSKQSMSGAGFGLGDVTLENFLETHGLFPDMPCQYDLGFVIDGPEAWEAVQDFARSLRAEGARVFMPLDSNQSMKSQLKALSKLKLPRALIVGSREMESGHFVLKNMQTQEQKELPLGESRPSFASLK